MTTQEKDPRKARSSWRKDKKETQSSVDLRTDNDFEEKDVGVISLFGPFLKGLAKSKNPAKLPYPPCFYLPASSLMHMTHLQLNYVDLLVQAGMQSTPEARFLGYLKFCISTYGLTKFPYKPIISLLGETAQYSSPYGSSQDPDDRTYILAENIKKDPPHSLLHMFNPKHGISLGANVEMAPEFHKTHVHVAFKGQSHAVFAHPGGLYREDYFSDIPDFMIRLLRMSAELYGDINITSSTGFSAHLEFKEKSMFGKAKNLITGKVSFNGAVMYTLDGGWDEVVFITNVQTNGRAEFINRQTLIKNGRESLPLEDQPESSSDKIWGNMLELLMRKDFDAAVALKTQINEDENRLLSEPEKNGQEYIPRYFRKNAATGRWEIKDPALCLDMNTINLSSLGHALPAH